MKINLPKLISQALLLSFREAKKGSIIDSKRLMSCPYPSSLSELISEVIYRLGETGLDFSWGLIYHLIYVRLGAASPPIAPFRI